jgi:hypothetical protein
MRLWRRVTIRSLLIYPFLACALSLGACFGGTSDAPEERSAPSLEWWGRPAELDGSWAPAPRTQRGLTRIAETSGQRLLLHTAGGEIDFVPGVNIGPTVPGRLPGEHAVRAADYRRWFSQIASVGLRAVRVYTILPPYFYEELVRYNTAHASAPLYLMQGVWIPEREFLASKDLYSADVHEGFKAEISDAVAAVHGDLVRPTRPGHASGTYTADASAWLLSYSIGVEWDPRAILASDRINAGHRPYRGRYFSSSVAATPTEIWLAEMLDQTARAEAERGLTVPLTFTNWPTTDPLRHPEEPLMGEDAVGIDANHIQSTRMWGGGFFASFHAYPYYPDFMRHEPALATYKYKGRSDPYAGYLHKLREHFAHMPLMITEFGVPSSLGNAHLGPLGRDQGDHTEGEQMKIDGELLRLIHDLDLSGAFAFEWTDEWFKFTWNTIDFELPEARRQLWRNPLTNEENFGLVATEPGEDVAVVIDGDSGEWEENESQVIFEARTDVRVVRAVKDEAYLYLLVSLENHRALEEGIALGFDVVDGGNGGLPGSPGIGEDADYAVSLDADEARAWVRASNDPIVIRYGKNLGYFQVDAGDVTEGSGVWDLEKQLLNYPMTVPSTREKFPAEEFDLGVLRRGTTDPHDSDFDSTALWAAEGETLEIRLPYQMIGFTDPSSRTGLVVEPDGTFETQRVNRLGITVEVGGHEYVTNGYSWDIWNMVSWHERPKAGIEKFAKAVADTLDR